jgi:hypothetical protein
MWFLIGVPVATITAIAVIREVYLSRFGDATGGINQLGPVAGTLIFAVINVLIYLGALILSYLHHDPEGEMIERLEKEHHVAERRASRTRHQVDRAQRYSARLQARLERWRGGRDSALRQARMHAMHHKDFFEGLMKTYEAANRAAVERLLRKQEKARLRAQSKADRRGRSYIAETFRRSSESKAFARWPEIALSAFPADLDWTHDSLMAPLKLNGSSPARPEFESTELARRARRRAETPNRSAAGQPDPVPLPESGA